MSLVNPEKIEVLENLKIKIIFDNGDTKTLDVKPYCIGEVFKPFLSDKELSETARLDVLGGIEWSNGASLSPETVYFKSI